MTTKLPHSTVKRMLLGDSGLRANGAAVEAFSAKINEFADSESKRIASEVVQKRRKTVYEQDVNGNTEISEETNEETDELD